MINELGLKLFLPLYRLDGGSLASCEVFGHAATVTGALWRPYGQYFDGIDDYISVAHSPPFDFGTGSFHVAEVFHLLTLAEIATLRKAANLSNPGHQSWIGADGKVYYYLTFSPTVYQYRSSNSSLSAGVFFHVIRHFDRPNNTGHIYINGRQDDGALVNAGGFSPATDISNSQNLIVGHHPNADDPYANIVHAEIAIYQGDIEPARALALYHDARKRLPWL